ncbi:hypothetical protein HC931_18785 [Candidatus Gracilibacteria bacterium]|nr:hypothetical protein [Candidatus Gracilibacteria bacterium]NJM88789.1 hypothetical protein [Hydrococcus sp. RU_2_2]NJP21840.1 hypothetical protein [Hydrococcus sp. CRU_1_1]
MNAAEQATSIEMVSKIATIVNLFKSEFPDTLADLNPWIKNSETEKFIDPDSLDISFHFLRRDRACNSCCILMLIQLKRETLTQQLRAIGIELSGHDCRGQQWRLSTLRNWELTGMILPTPEGSNKLKQVCHQTLKLFNASGDRSNSPSSN